MTPRRVVLVGVGHTHAHVVRQWRSKPPKGAELVCISPFPVAAYSGMLPGTLARQYQADQMQIALEPFCRAAGADLIVSRAVAVDLRGRRVELANGAHVEYDLLSIGIGSIPQAEGVEIAPHAVTMVKPMQTFVERLDKQVSAAASESQLEARPLNVAIVGGGAAGVELAFCVDRRLAIDYPRCARLVTIIDPHATVLAAERPATRRLATRLLRRRGIALRLESRVVAVGSGQVVMEQGPNLPADVVIWAAGAGPPPLLASVELPKDDAGFLLTRHTLQSSADDRVLVVGDTGTIAGKSYAKAGVYAVREGPVLWKNLLALQNGGRLEEYHPQAGFLRLLNTGDGKSVLDWHGLAMHSRWCWWLKDRIDRRFVGRYQA